MTSSSELNADETQSVPVSPTLLAQQRYVSILAKVPDELAQYVLAWRDDQPEIEDSGSVHITVLVSPAPDNMCDVYGNLGSALNGTGCIPVSVGQPASFSPITAVSYLTIDEGADELIQINAVSEHAAGASASPFDYHPHITLAQHVPESVLLRSLEYFAHIPEHLKHFEIDTLRVYEFDGAMWRGIGSIDLKKA